MSLPGWNIPDFASPLDGGARALLTAALDAIEIPSRREVHAVDRGDAAQLLDAIAVRCARGRGACDLAIGAELALMERMGGENRLGFSQVVDFARERLGLHPAFTRRLVRLDQQLGSRPLLREAVRRGDVTRRKAEIVVGRAVREEEARWVELAKRCTARELEALARSPGAVEAPDEDEPLRRIFVALDPEEASVVKEGLLVAGVVAGPATPTAGRLEIMAMEYLSSHAGCVPEPPAEEPAPGNDWAAALQLPSASVLGDSWPRRPDLRAVMEKESDRWRFLGDAPTVAAPGGEDPEAPYDPYAAEERLRALVALRNAWDHDLGRAALRIQVCGSWRAALFESFEHDCHERLGMGASTVKQRIALERRLHGLPALREAMRTGRLSYEQARLVSRVATPADVEARIEAAAGMTCIELQRSLASDGEVQMWNERTLDVVVPLEVAEVLGDAVAAARAAAKQWLRLGQALVAIASPFVATHGEEARKKLRKADQVKKRDRFRCQVPGCSRAADHGHHIILRSRGGPDEDWNEIAVCAIHHLRCIHRGYVLVTGIAPDGLTWVLGEREVAATLRGEGA